MEQPLQFAFGDIHVDVVAHTVRKGDVAFTLEPKAFGVLLQFLAHPGELLTRDQLLDVIWGHRHVTPGVLNRVIANLRRALGDDIHEPRYIATVHGFGYRFVGTLCSDLTTAPPLVAQPDVSQTPMSVQPNRDDAVTAEHRPDDDQRESQVRVRRRRSRSRSRSRTAWLVMTLLVAAFVALGFSLWRQSGQNVSTLARSTQPAGLAVLPFSAPGDDADLGAAAEGLSESLTDAFARTADVRVAGRESVLALGRGRGSVQRIAEVLDVDYVLSGEAHANGIAIDLRIGLWRRGETVPVWIDEQSMPRDQLFRVVVPLIERVRTTVLPALVLAPEQLSRQAAIPAQDLYWLGRRYWYQRTPASLARA
ncbi:MAG: winged helix-turn-helix domain-containing protein, partial [Dokdonella sp.]